LRFLVDNALSPRLARLLAEAGHDVVHVRDRGLQSAKDSEILKLAERERRVLISTDTDFGALLTLGQGHGQAIILLRGDIERHPEEQARVLLANLDRVSASLQKRAIVVVTRSKLRIREL